MKKKSGQFLIKGIVILVSTAVLWGCILQGLYVFDNKYSHGGPQPQEGVLTIDQTTFEDGKFTFLVDDWSFYNGQLLSPSDFKTQDISDPQMVYIGQYPDFSMRNTEKSPFGYATYRMQIINKGAPIMLSMTLQEIFSSATVWVNGTVIEKLGETNPQNYEPHIQNSVVSFYVDGKADIIINTTNFSHYYSGLYYPPALGEPQTIAHLVYINQIFYAFLCFSALSIAVFTFFVWFSPKKDKLFFYYGILTFAFAVHIAYVPLRWIGVPLTGSLYAIEDCSYYVMILSIVSISSIIAQIDKKNIYRQLILPVAITMCLVSVIVPLLVLPEMPWILEGYGVLLDTYQCSVCIYLIFAAFKALKVKNIKAYFVMAVNAVFGMSLVFQVTNSNEFEPIFTGWQLEYAGFIIVVVFGIMMVRYYREILAQNRLLSEHLEEQVVLRTEELTTLMNERKKFFADVAHDLKAPVSAIQAFIDLVRVGNVHVDEELRAYLTAIDQKSNEVQARVNSLRAFTTWDEVPAKFIRMNLTDFFKTFYHNNLPDAEANGVNFELEIPEKKIWIQADEQRLLRVFENLFYNAISFTEVDGHIKISVKEDKEVICIVVEDDGKGISEKNLPKIFDRFFSDRGEEASKSQGLGLYIVRQIIKEHGGEITAKSEKNSGTVFTIQFKKAES